jgi:NMD protein affecting ribosome stability and mRNA decay
MKKFCAKCGKTEGTILKGLCVEHYEEKYPFLIVDEKIPIQMERTTGTVLFRGKWNNPDQKTFQDIVMSKVKIEEVENHEVSIEPTQDDFEFIVHVTGKIDGEMIAAEKSVLLQPTFVQSDAEMRINSNYHEAILQLRFENKPTPKEKKAFEEEAVQLISAEKKRDTLSAVSQRTDLKAGINLFIASNRAGRTISQKLARRHKGKITIAFKVVGRDKTGKDKIRVTYCVRIPNGNVQ